jgi:hypothetical protein
MSRQPRRPIARSQARALAWEEARVGGAIAAACTAVGMVLLLVGYFEFGSAAWQRDDFLTHFAGIWVPIFVAFLLVLNPDYSGHLAGGFSKRILGFPVKTRLAVAVSLASRTILVFGSAALLVGLSGLLFDGAPGVVTAFLVVAIYLAAQVVDWLRGPVSGLSSLAALGVVVLLARWLWPGAPEFAPLASAIALWQRAPVVLPLATGAGGLLAYAVSVVTVGADRTGRRFGVPEIWEWPRRVSFPASAIRAPFRSALSAQAWFEIRRSRGLLPVVAALAFGAIFALVWISFQNDRYAWNDHDALRVASNYGILVAVLAGALAHGIQTRVLGFRRTSGKPGYEYLQPLPDAHFALARVIAGAAMLLPTLAIALAAHFLIAGRIFTFEIPPQAYALGVSSTREVAWMFLSRGLLVALLAGPLLVIGARLCRRFIAVLALAFILAFVADELAGTDLLELRIGTVANAFALIWIVGAIVLSSVAWRQGLFPARHVFAWAVAWAALAWLLHYPLAMQWVSKQVPAIVRGSAWLAALGAGALLPLAYLAIVFDVRKRRHSTATSQDRSQLVEAHAVPGRRVRIAIGAGVMAVAAVWLGWPSTAAYIDFRRDRGYPATLTELDASYAEPPPGQNAAPELLALETERVNLVSDYDRGFLEIWREILNPEADQHTGPQTFEHYLYVVGGRELPRAEPLDGRAWAATETYWQQVTSVIAPELKSYIGRDTSLSRYPIDLTEGFSVEVLHLARVRALGRELQLDSLHWAVASKPENAVDSILAGFALAESLSNEPVLMSQFVRVAILGSMDAAIEQLLNRSLPSDADLLRLQRACENAYGPREAVEMAPAFIGETLMILDAFNLYNVTDARFARQAADLWTLAVRLAFPAATHHATVSVQSEKALDALKLTTWAGVQERARDLFDRPGAELYSFAAPVIGVLTPNLTGAWEVEHRARTQLDAARVALAIERFRLAHDRIPSELEELVPELLSDVPEDPFARGGGPLRYLTGESGEYAVFSVGRNESAETGRPRESSERYDDLAITVAPMSVRAGPHIDEE